MTKLKGKVSDNFYFHKCTTSLQNIGKQPIGFYLEEQVKFHGYFCTVKCKSLVLNFSFIAF